MSLLGADLPSNLMPPFAGNNDAGFWESLDIYKLNDQILASAGSSWDDWRRFNPEWMKSPVANKFKSNAIEILKQEFSNSSLFVLKDPRFCRLLRFWLEAIGELGIRIKCVLPLRNPLEIAASLHQRDGFSPAKSYVLWLRHVLDAEQASRKLPRVFVSYEGLLQDWRGVVGHISDALEISWPRRSAVAEVEIDKFLNDRHRHHSINQAAIYERPEVAGWVRSATEALAMLLSAPYARKPMKRLDGIRAEFNRANDALGAVLQAEESAKREAEEGKERLAAENRNRLAQIAKTENKVQELQQCLTEKNEKMSNLAEHLESKNSRINDLQQSLNKLREIVATKEQRTSDLEQLEAHREKLLNNSAIQLEKANTQISDLIEEVTNLTKALREREGEIGKIKQAAEQIKQEHLSELYSLQKEKEEVEGRLVERTNAMDALTEVLKKTENAAKESDEKTQWLRQVASILLTGAGATKGRFLSFSLSSIKYRLQKTEMKKRGIFDPAAYLAANPDVAKSGVDPLRHYILHGIAEGRRIIPGGSRKDACVDETNKD
jgi:hypothetical protein